MEGAPLVPADPHRLHRPHRHLHLYEAPAPQRRLLCSVRYLFRLPWMGSNGTFQRQKKCCSICNLCSILVSNLESACQSQSKSGVPHSIRIPSAFHLRSIRIPSVFHPRSIRVPSAVHLRSLRVPPAFQIRDPRSIRIPSAFHPRSMRAPSMFHSRCVRVPHATRFQNPHAIRVHKSGSLAS